MGYHKDDCKYYTSKGIPKHIDQFHKSSYLDSALYFAHIGNLEGARQAAHWPDASIKDFTEENLLQRYYKVWPKLEEKRKKTQF